MIVVDHDAGRINNCAILEIGYLQSGCTPFADVDDADVARWYFQAANAPPRPADAKDSPALTTMLTAATSTDPRKVAHVDAWLGRFFGGGCRAHIDGMTGPFVRIGHPAGPDEMHLDVQNASGVVVGVLRNAWLDGAQLRGDIVFLNDPPPPIPDWHDGVLPGLLGLAADRAESLGLSICALPLGDGLGLPVAADLVSRPSRNRNGLVGCNGSAAVREVGRRRPYRADLGQRGGALVYESLVESWLDGKEPT